MGTSAHQWIVAFAVALALHALAGSAIWMARNTAPEPPTSPRGVMVSLDSLMVGNTAQFNETPQSVEPVQAAPAVPASNPSTPQPAAAQTVSPASPAPATPAPVEPIPASAAQAPSAGAAPAAGGVDIPVAQTVTVDAADTLAALEQVPTIQAQPPAAVPAQHGSGAQGNSDDPTLTYIARIKAWFANHKYYPRVARSSGAEGVVRLYLVVDRGGDVLNVAVADSSGSPVLDQAAMDMVKRSEPLPPMTDDMLRTRLEFYLPVRFTLGDSTAATTGTTK